MYGALYTMPNPTLGEWEAYSPSGVANVCFCQLLFAGFLFSLCPKHALIWGNCHEKLCIEIFVRVLCSSEVISLILCK